MIIIEGPDGCGKTTLGRKLVQDGLVKQVLDSPSRTRGEVPLFKQSERYFSRYGKDNSIAVDRFLFSEQIYGPIFRGGSKFTLDQYFEMLGHIFASGCPIILCLPKRENVNLAAEKQMPGVIEKIDEVYNAYQKLWQNLHETYWRTFLYQFDNPNSYPGVGIFLNKIHTSDLLELR